MERKEFIEIIDEKLKLVRTEYDYTQDKMAGIIGISKKTLVDIEKGRSSLGWIGAVALCTIFADSEIISMTFGGAPTDIILALAFDGDERERPKTMGGKVWWREIAADHGYKIQQNIISSHYRILDAEDNRLCASFDYEYIKKRYGEVIKK